MEVDELPGAPPMQQGREPRNAQWMPYGHEADLQVTFYRCAQDGKDHCKVQVPGDKHLVVDDVAEDRHKTRFAREWAIYRQELDEFAGQTRVETVAWIDPATVAELKHAGIHTVEQLASVSDATISTAGMIGLLDLRRQARSHVEAKRRVAGYEPLQARIEALEGQAVEAEAARVRIADLEAQLAAALAKPATDVAPKVVAKK